MRYSAEEKMEIISLTERSELSVKRTLKEIGVSRSTFYNWYDRYLDGGVDALFDRVPRTSWNKIPDTYRAKVIDVALDRTADSPRELATFMTDNMKHFISESSVYRILKAVDLITSPNHILLRANDEFKDKTTYVHQMWQTDFTYFKIEGWGWYYLSTILDDYSRFIIHHELCKTMKTPDVMRSVDAALEKTGLKEGERPKILSDNGPCYVSKEIKEYMKSKSIKQVHGAPMHPQTQGKIERYHRTMKNVVKLEKYYMPEQLISAIDEFVENYNYHRYHESLENCTPANVLLGQHHDIIRKRQKLKQKSMRKRRINHMRKSQQLCLY